LEPATTVGIAVAAFAATNIDDLFLIVLFLTDPRVTWRHVALGQFAGIGTLVLLSVAAALLARQAPPGYVALLGLAPLGLGIRRLLTSTADDDPELDIPEERAGWGTVLAISAITLANGGDNLGVYIPLFAHSTLAALALILSVFALLILVWVGIGWWLTQQAPGAERVRQVGKHLLPWVLIGLGLLILWEARLLGTAERP